MILLEVFCILNKGVMKIMRIPFDVMKAEIKRAMLKAGLTEEQADICAQVHTESSRDGVYSHGLNRVPRFINYVKKGWIDIKAVPTFVKGFGCMENYDGNMGGSSYPFKWLAHQRN